MPDAVSQTLWKRFRKACDEFFNRKQQYFEGRKGAEGRGRPGRGGAEKAEGHREVAERRRATDDAEGRRSRPKTEERFKNS